MATTTCKYRKTKSGQWAVMGPADVVRPGATVTVTKADGSTKTERIVSVGKPFDGLVYGYPAPREHRSSGGYGRGYTPRDCECDGMSFGERPGSKCSNCGGIVG